MSASHATAFEPETLPLAVTREERTTAARHRAAGVDDETIGVCLAATRTGRLIDRHRDRCRHVVVACMPKSASTFLCRVLASATGFDPYLLNTTGHDNERNIEPGSIPMFLWRDTVSQEHMRATRANVAWLERLGVRPVVLVRDIFDVIVSTCDHAVREPGRGPAAHTPRGFEHWSRRDRLWFIVRMGTPWLLSFVTSWIDAGETLDPLWVTYDDAVNATAATATRVLRHAGVEIGEDRLDAAIARVDPAETRFNRGVAGRGRTELSAAQCEAVRGIAAAHRDVYDLSIIGL